MENLDLELNQGEILGLIGPNGSGKSTTVNLICGVFPVSKSSRDGAVVFRTGCRDRYWLSLARAYEKA